MNKSYFLVTLLLSAALTGCIASDDESLTEMSISEAAYLIASKIIVEHFNEIFYEDVCEHLMYEDGSFYNSDDISTCVKGAENKYMAESDSSQNSNDSRDSALHAFLAPDWEYINFRDTGKEAALTGTIYQVSGVGIYCGSEDSSSDNHGRDDDDDDYDDDDHNNERAESECFSMRILEFYMAKNTKSGTWGYAAEGFRTTDGTYLQVIIPDH